MQSPGTIRHAASAALAAAVMSWSLGAAAAPPLCQIQGRASGRVAPVSVSFQALAAAGATPYAFHWDFGDGSSSTERDPSHTYVENGGYQAILTVTDSDVPPRVCRDTVDILLGSIADPLCGAVANTRWGEAPLQVQLTAYPALIGDPEPYSWSWRFGDGEASSIQSPTHTYDDVGTYYAVATVHTSLRIEDCVPTLRISAIPPVILDVTPPTAPRGLTLESARPNPFGGVTAIGFELPRAGRVRLEILDLGGRAVATLVNEHRAGGRHVALWQARAGADRAVPAGLYFARLEHEGLARNIRILRLP